MSDASYVVGPGSGTMTVELPSNLTNFSFLDEINPGVPASNSQAAEWVKVTLKGKVGRAIWFFPTKTTWSAKIEFHDLAVEHSITYTAS